MAKIRKKSTQDELEAALSDVRSGRSVNSISKSSGIPKSTLLAKIIGHRPLKSKQGPPTILTEKEEDNIFRWMLHLSNRGFPVTKSQLINSVKQLLKKVKEGERR